MEDPVQLDGVLVPVVEDHLHLDHPPHPLLELGPAFGRVPSEHAPAGLVPVAQRLGLDGVAEPPQPVVGQHGAPLAEDEDRRVHIFSSLYAEEPTEVVRPVVSDGHGLEQVLPPYRLGAHAREGVRVEYLVRHQLLQLWREEDHEKVPLEPAPVVQHDRLQLLQAHDVQRPALGLLHLRLVLHPVRPPLEALPEVRERVAPSASAPVAAAAPRGVARRVVPPPAARVAQDLEGVGDPSKPLGRLLLLAGVLVRVALLGPRPVGRLDLLGRGLPRDAEDRVEILRRRRRGDDPNEQDQDRRQQAEAVELELQPHHLSPAGASPRPGAGTIVPG